MDEVFEFKGQRYFIPMTIWGRGGTVRLADTGELVDLSASGEASLHTGPLPHADDILTAPPVG
jgi:hypothetical protein